MKRLLLQVALAAGLLAPKLALAQDEKPSLNTAPPAPVLVQPAPVPVQPVQPAPATTSGTYTPPADYDRPAGALPAPSQNSPSGLELPQREQERKAAQQHSEMYSKLFIYTGFGLGLNGYYGATQFNVSASPALGYRINDRLSVGPGISYAYNSISFDQSYNYPTAQLHNIGVKAFAQFRVYDQFFLHAEYEVTRAQLLAPDANGNLYPTNNKWNVASYRVETPLAGVGYRSQISTRAAADIVLLYNFKDNYNSIYPNPVLRFNFLFNIGK